jgi:hypothetical protein
MVQTMVSTCKACGTVLQTHAWLGEYCPRCDVSKSRSDEALRLGLLAGLLFGIFGWLFKK